MKRTVALTILGVAAVTATNAFGQGAFQFSNYASPYVPIVYDAGVPGLGGDLVASGQGVVIEVWAAAGAAAAEGSLNLLDTANITAFAGYTDPNQLFTIPAGNWIAGDWTVQLRASGTAGGQAVDTASSRGPLVTLSPADQTVSPPEIPSLTRTDGFTVFVPEPTTFALAGLGAAALVIFRRRS